MCIHRHCNITINSSTFNLNNRIQPNTNFLSSKMKSFTTLLTLAALFAIALGASLPLASDRHRGPLKPKPSNHLRSMVERLVANGTFPDDENTRLFSEYPCGDDDDDFDKGDNFQPDECTTASTTSDIPSSTSFVDAKGDNDIHPNTVRC
jgi:hypothetical protein